MEKKTIALVMLLLLIAMVLAMTGCRNVEESKLVGRWVLASHSSYWSDLIILSKDGTGVCEGPITWKVENNRLYLLHPSGLLHPEYEYELSGSELMLAAMGETAIYRKEK